jgi:hypothetical protein
MLLSCKSGLTLKNSGRTIHLCVPYGSQNKQRLFPLHSIKWFLYPEAECLLRGTDCIFIFQVNISLERVNKMCLLDLERGPWFQHYLSSRSLVMVLTRSMIIDGLTLCSGTRTCTSHAKMTLRSCPVYSAANYFLSTNNY